MIIKKMDSKQEEIAELTALLKGRLISYQRFLIERELKAISLGTVLILFLNNKWIQTNYSKTRCHPLKCRRGDSGTDKRLLNAECACH
jgi:hypothetical protein